MTVCVCMFCSRCAVIELLVFLFARWILMSEWHKQLKGKKSLTSVPPSVFGSMQKFSLWLWVAISKYRERMELWQRYKSCFNLIASYRLYLWGIKQPSKDIVSTQIKKFKTFLCSAQLVKFPQVGMNTELSVSDRVWLVLLQRKMTYLWMKKRKLKCRVWF